MEIGKYIVNTRPCCYMLFFYQQMERKTRCKMTCPGSVFAMAKTREVRFPQHPHHIPQALCCAKTTLHLVYLNC